MDFRTVVKRESDCSLESWRFVYLGRELILDQYEHSNRATKRSKFVLRARYDRVGARSGGIIQITEEGAPLPADVSEEALVCFLAHLDELKEECQVSKWQVSKYGESLRSREFCNK